MFRGYHSSLALLLAPPFDSPIHSFSDKYALRLYVAWSLSHCLYVFKLTMDSP